MLRNYLGEIGVALGIMLIVAMANAYSDIQELKIFAEQGPRHTAIDAHEHREELMRELDQVHDLQQQILDRLLSM